MKRRSSLSHIYSFSIQSVWSLYESGSQNGGCGIIFSFFFFNLYHSRKKLLIWNIIFLFTVRLCRTTEMCSVLNKVQWNEDMRTWAGVVKMLET